MEVCALRRFYFSFPLPDRLPLLPKECGFPTFRRLLPKEFYTCHSSDPSHKTYIDLSTAGQTSTPSKGVRIPHVSATPSEGVLRTLLVPPQPQNVYRPFHCRTDFHSFQRSTDFPRSGDSFRRSITHATRPIPATRRISTFPPPDRLPLLPKECGFPTFRRLLPKEFDIKQLPGDFQLFRCR